MLWHIRRAWRQFFGLTTEDVVRHVAATPGWYLDGRGRIRRRVPNGIADPITSLAGAPMFERDAVLREVRVNRITADIVTAASNEEGGPAEPVRQRLLAAAEIG